METNGLCPKPHIHNTVSAASLVRLAFLILLGFLTSCNQFSLEVANKGGALELTLPTTLGFVPLTSMNNYPMKGKCTNLTTVTLRVDGIESTLNCNNGQFQSNYDFSGKLDGNITIEASGTTKNNELVTVSRSIVKDTVPPSAALVIAGLGSSYSADPLPRSVTITTTQDDYFYKTALINSGTCAGVDFSAVPARALTFFPISLVANQNNTLCVLSSDRAGNWRVSAVSSTQVYLDTVLPALNFSVSSIGASTNSSVTVDWTLTELNPDAAQNMTLEFSPNGSAPWTILDQRTVGATSLSSAPYSYSWTTPGTNASGKLRLTYTDRVGNVGSSTIDAIIDGGSPVIDSILLADGNTVVGVPSIKVNLTTTPSISPITQVRFSENSSFTGATWVSYNNGERFFTVTPTSGPKTIYAQVRSATGQTSNIVSGNITLDFGNPPNMRILSPLAGTPYAPGQTVTISWECSTTSIVGLAAVPIPAISYSVDDGISYHNIATNLTNNDSATTGSRSWTIPATTPTGQTVSSAKPLRIMGYCSAASGVVSSGMSDLLNSEWRVLAGEPGNLEEGIHLSLANLDTTSGIFGDSSNNLYYSHKNAIMKIDSKSGLVSTWLGNMEVSGCNLASGFTGATNLPHLIDITANEMLFYSFPCERLYKVSISTKQVVWSKNHKILPYSSVTGEMRFSYVKSGFLYFTDDYRLYEWDLNVLTSTPRHIGGTGTCSATLPANGIPATTAGIICTTKSISVQAAVSPDRKKIWVTTGIASGPNTVYFEYDEVASEYVTKTEPLGGALSRCINTDFDSDGFFCLRVIPGNTSRAIYYVNTTALTVSAIHELPTYKSLAGQTYIGASKNSILSFTNSNELFESAFDSTAVTFTTNKIGGKAFHIFGNGNDIGKVAFTGISDFAWDPVSNNFFVRGAQHIRRLHLDTTGTPTINEISSASASSIPNSTPMYGFAVSPDGTIIANCGTGTGGSSWRTVTASTWDSVAETVANGTNYYVTRTTYLYPTLGASFVMNGGASVRNNPYMVGTILPNNKLYFMGTSESTATNDLWIYESNRTNVKSIAGAAGAGGYNASDNGGPALGARITNVYGMQPVLTAPLASVGDLLIFDGPRLRRVSVATFASEAGSPTAPTIHDEINFSSFTNYPGNKSWDHAIYDEATGWSYFAYAADPALGEVPEVWAARAAEGFVRINTDGIILSRNGPKSLKMQISPLGLVLLDSNKRRLIYTELFN